MANPNTSVFLNENNARGLAANTPYQHGITDIDNGSNPLNNQSFPWVIDPKFTFLGYIAWIEYELDAGIVVHRILPQQTDEFDSLAQTILNDPTAPKVTEGINLKSNAHFTDCVQRMGHSIYRACLKGAATRIGYQVVIPKMTMLGGVPAIPDDRKKQKVKGPILIANNFGIPTYYATWELWYTTSVPPKTTQAPPDNLAQQITSSDSLPPQKGIPMPLSQPDQKSKTSAPSSILLQG